MNLKYKVGDKIKLGPQEMIMGDQVNKNKFANQTGVIQSVFRSDRSFPYQTVFDNKSLGTQDVDEKEIIGYATPNWKKLLSRSEHQK